MLLLRQEINAWPAARGRPLVLVQMTSKDPPVPLVHYPAAVSAYGAAGPMAVCILLFDFAISFHVFAISPELFCHVCLTFISLEAQAQGWIITPLRVVGWSKEHTIWNQKTHEGGKNVEGLWPKREFWWQKHFWSSFSPEHKQGIPQDILTYPY